MHDGVACDVCGTSPLVGVRYKCVNCDDFNMCEKCDASGAGEHPSDVVVPLGVVVEGEEGVPKLVDLLEPERLAVLDAAELGER